MNKRKTKIPILSAKVVERFISVDTYRWFNKLSLVNKLKAIEEQIKTQKYFMQLKRKWNNPNLQK